jgi:phospholipase/carboxylesterase
MLEYKSCIKPLGVRRGSPPHTTPERPHEQLTQNGPSALREELYERAIALPGVVEGSGRASTPLGTRAFLLEPGYAGGPPQAFLIGDEFTHLHPDHDGSMCLTLPRNTSDEIVARGWGEVHVDTRLFRRGTTIFVMVYGPRDEDELEAVWRIFRLSYEFALGLL